MTGPRTDARTGGRSSIARACSRACVPALLAGALTAATAAHAAGPETRIRWASVGLLAGSAQPVAAMADYQWDVRPHAAWGAQLLAGLGRFAAGLRGWQGGTTQSLGLAGVTDPNVRMSSLELVARARLAEWRGIALAATAAGGRLALRYSPDQVTVGTSGAPVEVTLSPVHEWVAGAGLALQAPLPGDWNWGLELERRVFALDTAHRNGSSIEYARETFGDWDARVAVTHAWNW